MRLSARPGHSEERMESPNSQQEISPRTTWASDYLGGRARGTAGLNPSQLTFQDNWQARRETTLQGTGDTTGQGYSFPDEGCTCHCPINRLPQ